MAGWPHGYAPHLIVPSGSPSDGDTLVWDAASSQWRPGASGGGGGASTPPGQAAHYIGTWAIGTAYAAGDCVRQWDGAEFKLYQAKTATTGDDPTSVVASWAEVTTPIVMWGTEDPNTTDTVNAHGGGIVAPYGSSYTFSSPTIDDYLPPGILIFTHWDDANFVGGAGSWEQTAQTNIESDDTSVTRDVYAYRRGEIDGATDGTVDASTSAVRDGAGVGSANAFVVAERLGSGNGGARADIHAQVGSSSTGDADVSSTATLSGTATGTAKAGDVAIHYAGGEAHVKPTASATAAFNDVKADLIFTDNTEGPVIHDQSDGHTYRIVSTAGVLSTVQVT